MIRPPAELEAPELARLIAAVAGTLRLYNLDDAIEDWTAQPSGNDTHRLGLWQEGALVAATRVTLNGRARLRHSAELTLISQPGVAVDALLAATVSLIDDWTPIDRLEITLPADHPTVPSLRAVGFQDEVYQRRRHPDGADGRVLGRLRPGFVPRPPGPPPAWPQRRAAPEVEVRIRPLTEADSAGVAALSTTPTAVWGTLQTPSSNDQHYRRRFLKTTPGNLVLVIEVAGQVAGLGGLHPTGIPGVASLGMTLHPDWQGCGLGRRLIDHQIRSAIERGARRLELGVWVDNTRAIALYERVGFVSEGARRCDGIRAGGHSSSMEMALFF